MISCLIRMASPLIPIKYMWTDTGARLLHVFDMKNNKYFQIRKTESEEFLFTIGIAVDSNEEIYMTDSMLRKVFVFDKTGKYLREIGNLNYSSDQQA